MSDRTDEDEREDPDQIPETAARLSERAREVRDRLDRWETGEDAGSEGGADLESVLETLDKWETSDDPGSGGEDATENDAGE